MNLNWVFIIVGFVFIFLGLIGLFSEQFQLHFPLFLYICDYIKGGNWKGFLLGVIIRNMLEVIAPILV